MSEQTGTQNINDVSAAFDLLRDARRRGVIYTVKRNGRTSVSELARRIAAWQTADGDESPDPATVETSLAHAHLPKLVDAGVVEYDREAGTVELAETTDGLDPFLERTSEREPGLVRAARTSNLERALEI
ncbi:hypothetical protein M0R89_11865 [Halorussus limi]|uniref:DUF7344 domain-containing protein n=1 Tax=Halorussus limi TaxID=2938695 RepID=A0A8U0HQM6_9EURY|nr:hypothetical protein [Halorussus limi]UPV73240.1 hypothetical protein M0R89_11865 [Halorussus limi]